MRLLATLLLAVICVTSTFEQDLNAEAQAGGGRAGQADINGFKIGDTVVIDTAFGWVDAQILAAADNTYRVRTVAGTVVVKTYPLELHRKGPFTTRDHEVGLYELKDRVQVNIRGQGWMDGVVITTRGLEYEVQLPGSRSAWASGENIRYVGPPASAGGSKTGAPPKPGFVPCAGALEGRWAPTNGLGGLNIEIRAGKATVAAMMGADDVLECWTAGTKIILRNPKQPEQDMPIDINKDGTLQTPLGELKKKGVLTSLSHR